MIKPKDRTEEVSQQDFNKIMNEILQQGKSHCCSNQEAKKHNEAITYKKRQEYYARVFKDANLPHLKYNDKLGNADIYKFVEKNVKSSFYLVSKKSGLCKTRTMIEFARQHIMSGKDVRFYSVAELSRDLSKAAYSGYNLVKDLSSVNLLVLDDLGKQKNTNTVESIFLKY
jgi:DNA replication protein DnaC